MADFHAEGGPEADLGLRHGPRAKNNGGAWDVNITMGGLCGMRNTMSSLSPGSSSIDVGGENPESYAPKVLNLKEGCSTSDKDRFCAAGRSSVRRRGAPALINVINSGS